MPRYLLNVEHKGGGRQRIPLDKPVVVIGRLEGCDVMLPDSNVSRSHARIRFAEDGIEIEDLGSKNFTYVNGEAVSRKRIEAGDKIAIGDNILSLEVGTAEAEITLSLSPVHWEIQDGFSPEHMTLLSEDSCLGRGKREVASDLGRLVQIYRFSQRINEKIGFFYLAREPSKGDFTRWDLEYLTAVANLAGVALANARHYRKALEENRQYEDIVQSDVHFVGKSPRMEEVYRVVSKIADSQASVLISGESGTGKELVARAIHAFSRRRMFRFVPINCAAIPENLLESELFGVERGAYTDAREKPGRIELAHKGTLFLDEINDMPPSLQGKLLRVLQQKEFERLGGVETRIVDVRIITATNRDIAKEVQEGRFREDLLYRIQVLRIDLPPLRERKEDIPLLAEHFLNRFAERNGTCVKKLSRDALEVLIRHEWPGNVRELENAIESAVVLGGDWILWPADFPPEVQRRSVRESADYPTLLDVERGHVLNTLRFCNGNKKKTAQALGITRQTLDNKLARYVPKA